MQAAIKNRASSAYPPSAKGQKRFKLLAALALLPALACAQMNDTGQTQCFDTAGAAMPCAALADHPGQDGRFGRDAQAGAAAFDFIPLGSGCVADRVTGLVWRAASLPAQSWADAASSAASTTDCGFTTGWRLPTRRELLSIVHHGASGPAIAASAFPATHSAPYWSSDAAGGQAWAVDFSDGGTRLLPAAQNHVARPVVRPANQPPTITLGADIVVAREDRPGPRTYPAWATGISPGPAREAGQHLTATVELLPLQPGDPKALVFEVPPAIDLATGNLTFTIQHRIDIDLLQPDNRYRDSWVSSAGLARVRVTLRDDGGTANGGQDTASAEFTIFLDPKPVALDQQVRNPWKASCIPISFMALDIDTDPVIADTWQQGDPWPYPTFRILTQPTQGFIVVYVSRRSPDGDERPAIRFASKDLSFDYLLPQSGMVKVGTQAASPIVVKNSQPDLAAVMNPSPPRAGWDRPGSLRRTYNWVMTWCYVPFSSTFVGSDTLTFDVTDPDGNVSNAGAINIEIYEK